MSEGLVSTLSVLLLIGVGLLLKGKIPVTQRKGIKQVILSLALPAVIFIALQKVSFTLELVMLPFLALSFNIIVFMMMGWGASLFGINKESSKFRTLRILVPSLAPGLSCFPFLLEFLGEEALANAAFADVGNKIFVLVILYVVALRWFYQLHALQESKQGGMVKKFVLMMVKEPVNMAIIAALLLVGFGVDYTIFPSFVQKSIDRLGGIMTPLIMIFIGISVKLSWKEANTIFSILLLRSAFAFLLSLLVIVLFQVTDPTMILLAVLFPQSSCSFWPYLHIEAVESMEQNLKLEKSTFDDGLALNLLAMSLPFSTVLILLLCTFKLQVLETSNIGWLAIFMLVMASITPISKMVKGMYFQQVIPKTKSTDL